MWNKLLVRQVKRHFGSFDQVPENLLGLIQDINNTYDNFDEDNQLLQTSIEISSQELRDAFQKQKLDVEAQKEILSKIREAIYALNPTGQESMNENRSEIPDSTHLFDSLINLIDERNKAEELLKQKTDEIERQNEELNQSNAQLVAAKVQAEESDRLKSAFLANMSHEIRTPINSILGFAQLLQEPELSADQQKEFISIIEKSGARMLDIIGDIICISKVEAGQMEVAVSETNINSQIEYLYELYKPDAEVRGLQFILKKGLPASQAILKTDREKVSAVLIHLLNNAVKFTREGSIEFGYEKKGSLLEFFVKDTGVGIRPEQKVYIFERFRQGSESLDRTYEGAGLGLSISKAYVEMLGGNIWVESEEGKGSAFYFTLPCHG